MPFDATLAIARLAHSESTSHDSGFALAALRERYPELDFIFNELADLRESTGNLPLGIDTVPDLAEAYDKESDRASRLAEALMDTRDRLDQIADADAASRNGWDAETVLNTLAEIREWVDSAIGRDA